MKTQFYEIEIVRQFSCTPARLFAAWADPVAKAIWFVGPGGWVEVGRSVDLREGGVETLYGKFGDSVDTAYLAHFYDVKENERIGYSFEVRLNGEAYSISTAVVEFTETESGVRMNFYEQLAAFDDQPIELQREGRLKGTNSHFDRLAKFVNK